MTYTITNYCDQSVVFSTMSISLVNGRAHASKRFYKNITIFNLLMRLIFAFVDVILNHVTYFSMEITSIF